MPAPLIIPDFIKQARLAAIGAGIPCGTDDATTAVLMLAATAYNRIPQVNRAEMLRQDLAKTQDELENVSSNLLAERKKSARLQATLDELQSTTSSPQMLASYKAACKQQGALMKENNHLKQQLAGVKRKQASALWQQIS